VLKRLIRFLFSDSSRNLEGSIVEDGIIEVIKKRRSVRRYKKESFPMEKLVHIIEAARWAPSAGNSQPWRFLPINDEKIVKALKSVSPGWLRDAPAVIMMCLNRESETNWSYMDIGAAMQNMLLYAHSMGYGCCPIGSFVVDAIKGLLELPTKLEPVLLLTVGYPDEKLPATTRLSTDELVFKKVGN
jgi:nitroreductase